LNLSNLNEGMNTPRRKGKMMEYRDRPLIPRAILFGYPDGALVHLSPDGAHLPWLAPLDGMLNVWVAPCDDLAAAHPVTYVLYCDEGHGFARS
jgi:hypothetical protein